VIVTRRLRRLVLRLHACLVTLPAAERRVITLRAGLDTGVSLSRREVARRTGLTTRAVRRLERRAIRRLSAAHERTGCTARATPPSRPVILLPGAGTPAAVAGLPGGRPALVAGAGGLGAPSRVGAPGGGAEPRHGGVLGVQVSGGSGAGDGVPAAVGATPTPGVAKALRKAEDPAGGDLTVPLLLVALVPFAVLAMRQVRRDRQGR